MVNILVIGATGYLGQALTQSLIRSGSHRVYGLARNSEKARTLSRDEVIPILGSISDNTTFLKALDSYQINIVVDVAGAHQESHSLIAELKKVGAARLEAAKSAGISIPKLGFIYCYKLRP